MARCHPPLQLEGASWTQARSPEEGTNPRRAHPSEIGTIAFHSPSPSFTKPNPAIVILPSPLDGTPKMSTTFCPSHPLCRSGVNRGPLEYLDARHQAPSAPRHSQQLPRQTDLGPAKKVPRSPKIPQDFTKMPRGRCGRAINW
ncbi:hypothetical protein BJ508DRAFT_129106 [Ascobolus immersus RN42]|uniref:Uncharacterized protein n=1 Tax=Ascobolus immersus RN42 TaxID=1160509 RepID=A0A3N4I341_ASCIM|nr:hypothetical protein BJ508DRAFT_129106 [Ascobolus immersus RN42]